MKVSWDDYYILLYIYGKIKNVPNHQPAMAYNGSSRSCQQCSSGPKRIRLKATCTTWQANHSGKKSLKLGLYMSYIWVIYGFYTFIYLYTSTLNPSWIMILFPFQMTFLFGKKASQTAAIMGPKNRGFSRHLGSLGPKIHRWNRSENRLSQQRWTLVKLSKELMVTLW